MIRLMLLLDVLYKLADTPQKIVSRLGPRRTQEIFLSTSTMSDSDLTPYSSFVESAISDPATFRKFRRNFYYRTILEHVDYTLGQKYLKVLNEATIENFKNNDKLRKLSEVGNPRLFFYRKIGWVSPTVLRYLFVNQHITEIFDVSKVHSIGEIGIGFGGQLAVSLEFLKPKSYAVYDLDSVIELTSKTIRQIGIDDLLVVRKSIDRLSSEKYDLVVSNYAFSELPKKTQIDYLRFVLSKSDRGYLTMNSGRTNISGRSEGKLSVEEILTYIPEAKIVEESPLTGPDNYLIIWGEGR
jgi:hypothetical protein